MHDLCNMHALDRVLVRFCYLDFVDEAAIMEQ